MNLKEHVLEELELHEYYVRDALQCLLHTILFVRAPGSLRPREVGARGSTVASGRACGARDVDVAVDGALEDFWGSLRPAGPDLSKGWIAVSFFMRRVQRSFGLFLKEEKVVWEQWVIPVLVNTSPRPMEEDETSVLARGRLQETAIGLVQGRLLDILNSVNDCIDHVPPVGTEYEFEMMSAPRGDRRESVYARLMQAPSPLNL
ncbi:unnamed protein product [Scytosiphon promiscuus]